MPVSKFLTLINIVLSFCGQFGIITSSFYIVLSIEG